MLNLSFVIDDLLIQHYIIISYTIYYIIFFFDVVNCVKLIMQISLIHIAFDYTYM